jgi:hypothetical protein
MTRAGRYRREADATRLLARTALFLLVAAVCAGTPPSFMLS